MMLVFVYFYFVLGLHFFRFYFTLQQSESLKSKILNCQKLSEMIGDLDVISINIQIADALAYLHQNNIIHRNMNPS